MVVNRTPLILRFLYNTRMGRALRPWLTSGRFNRFMGQLMRMRLSRLFIWPFTRWHRINHQESEKPLRRYTSFNDFFIRKLAKKARPIVNDARTFTSPADSYLSICFLNQETTPLYIKRHHVELRDIVGTRIDTSAYKDGIALVFRLAPYHYHRFHLPFGATISQQYKLRGLFETVTAVAYNSPSVMPLRNERSILECAVPQHFSYLYVAVGALGVGSITMTYHKKKNYYLKGEELGYFSFGGSTVVIVLPADVCRIDDAVLATSRNGTEYAVRMGEAIGTLITIKP
ncbi:MAG: phosphatidylserine decarboxylase [Candidatus Dependentiae bacterium]|jgi:phosphatidylserine decarboxylase